MVADPAEIMGPETGAGDDVEMVGGQPRHGQVAFDPAPGVEQLGIGQPSGGFGHVIRANPVQRGHNACALQFVFGERRLIEHAHMVAHMGMFRPDSVEPVLPPHAVNIRRPRRIAEPIGPLPPEFRPEYCALCG